MHVSKPPFPQETLQDALAYLDTLAANPSASPDYALLYRYITELTPYLPDTPTPPDLLRAMARLYYTSMRYAEAAEVLERIPAPSLDELRNSCAFYSGYCITPRDWASRYAEIWNAFQEQAPAFSGDDAQVSRSFLALKRRWGSNLPCTFATLAPPYGREKGKLLLDSLYGAISLIPMLSLIEACPVSVLLRWKVLLEDPQAKLSSITVLGTQIRMEDIQVQVSPSPVYTGIDKVRLQVWHPVLAEMAASGIADFAAELAANMVCRTLGLSAVVLYAEQIAVAERALAKGDLMPLPALKGWFQKKQLQLDIPADQAMAYRWYGFSRTPAEVSRPRADILRGETCMPELEEIYFLRNRKAMAALQRYGVGYWFLTIPKAVCGRDFYQFRCRLAQAVGKNTVYYTGWAEGTRYCYVDFLSMDSKDTLNQLHTYFQKIPGGGDIRICTFYWDSVLRTTDALREMQRTSLLEAQAPDVPVSPEDRAALEKAFLESQWHRISLISGRPPFGYADDGDEDEMDDLSPEEEQRFSDKVQSAWGSLFRGKNSLAEANDFYWGDDADDDSSWDFEDHEEEEEDEGEGESEDEQEDDPEDIDASFEQDAMGKLTEISAYLDACNAANAQYDYIKLHQCLVETMPPEGVRGSDNYRAGISSVLEATERFRESEQWQPALASPPFLYSSQYNCDLGSSYPNHFNHWEPRRQNFWKHFAAVEFALARQLAGGGDRDAIPDFLLWADAIFPTQELTLLPAGAGRKNTLFTGLPDGILTLPAMLYLTSHYPSGIGKRWNIAISGDGVLADGDLVPIWDEQVPASEIQVSLTEENGKVSLALWHPALAAQGDVRRVQAAAARIVNAALPMGTRLLYVADITAAPEALENAFPLPALRQQMQDRGFQTDISLDTLLSRRRYTITREPKDTGRPRDDILRGETCMPELDRIFYHLYEEGQVALERYGLCGMFLMIPNALCTGNSAQYRQQIQRYLSQTEGDKVFFTGWAEGTQYCYLDLISLHSRSLLSALNAYANNAPGGDKLLFCTAFWNSIPHAWRKEIAQNKIFPESAATYETFARAHQHPDIPVPDAAAAAELEASFQPLFTPEDLCTSKPAASPAAQTPAAGKKKLSKAQRKAQNSKNGKKKR